MRPVPHRVTNVGNEAIRDRLHQALRDAMRARDSVAAAAGYEGAGHGEQAHRLRQEARILTAVLDAGTRG